MSYDLNDAQPQMAPIGELIPDGTFAKVRLTIRPGGVNGATPADAGLLHTPLATAFVQAVEGRGLHRPLVLMLLEVGQHVVPGPTGAAELAPGVVVAGLAAHVDHAVDGRTAA